MNKIRWEDKRVKIKYIAINIKLSKPFYVKLSKSFYMYNVVGIYLIKENIKDNNLKHKTKLHQPKVEY